MPHHLYDPYFTPQEKKRLAGTRWDDLSHEIGLIRVLFMRYLKAEKEAAQPVPFPVRIYGLRVISRAVLSLGRMIRHEYLSVSPRDVVWQMLLQCIREANRLQGVVP